MRTERETCPTCLADLRDAPNVAVACASCGHLCDEAMSNCPQCLTMLRTAKAGERLDEGLVQLLASGARMLRPATVEAFRDGPYCELTRFDGESSLVLAGRDNLVEAYVGSRGNRAVVPMFTRDVNGEKLFRLSVYEASPRSLVAFDPQDTPLAIYQREDTGRRSMLVRDETSAPAARLVATRHGEFDYELIETGGGVLAGVSVNDTSWLDDAWRLHKIVDRLPFTLFGAIGMLLAAKVFFGRIEPEAPPSDDDEASVTDFFG